VTTSARVLGALMAAGMIALAPPASAASLVLDEAQQREALAFGERSVARDEFDDEWRVTNAAGDTVRVLTPFYRLALAARHAGQRGEPTERVAPDKLLKEQKDRLVLLVTLHGRREDFARHLVPELTTEDRTLKPAFVQNERTAARLQDGRFLARCVYTFPVKQLTGRSRVALVVRDGDAREASRFVIDLAAMR
jgi:hypothetical protein